jgi:hypothetical protein
MPHEHDAEPELAAARRAAQADTAGGSTTTAAPLPAGARPAAGRHLGPGHAIALQRAAGNRATTSLLGRPDAEASVQRIWPEDIPDGDAPATTAPGPTTGTQPNPAGAPPDGGSGSAPGGSNGSGGTQPTPPPPTGQAPAPPTLTKPTGSGPQPPTPTPAPSGRQPDPPTGSGGGPPDGGTPTVQPPPAPTPATPPGPGQVPDPNTAHSGIDFSSWTFADVYKVGRPALEMARVIPGWGLLAGAATDAITMETDLESVPSGDYPVTTALIGIRDGVALLNNAIGHVLYVDQLVQDGLAGSVIGIEFTPLTAEVNETLTSAKAVIDGLLVFGDVAIMVGASWNQSHADPNQSAAWQNIINSAAANLLGDAFGTIIDLISMASAGAANTEPVLKGSQFFGTAASLARSWKGVLLAWVQSIWNIWGGDLLGSPSSSPAPAPAAQRLEAGPDTQNALLAAALSGAADIMQTESASGRLAYTAIDAGITELEAEAAQQMAQMDAICQQLTGGKTIWQVIHDGAMSGIAKMREEVAGLQRLEAGATDAKANAAQVRAGVDAAVAQVNALQVPAVHIPQANLGDGALASAASSVINAVGSVADSGLQLAVDGVRSAVESAKSEALGPLHSAGAHADEIGEFLGLTAEVAGRETGVVQGKITDFESGLARCDGFESAIDLLVGGFADAAGLPRVTIQDLRDLWASVPVQFDRVDALAAGLQQRAAGLSAGGSDAGGGGGPVAAPPPPPDGGTQ